MMRGCPTATQVNYFRPYYILYEFLYTLRHHYNQHKLVIAKAPHLTLQICVRPIIIIFARIFNDTMSIFNHLQFHGRIPCATEHYRTITITTAYTKGRCPFY